MDIWDVFTFGLLNNVYNEHGVKLLVPVCIFTFGGYATWGGIAGSNGHSGSSHLKNRQTVFQSDCTIFTLLLAVSESPKFLQLKKPLLLSVFLTIGILVCGVISTVVLICVSLIANDVNILFFAY